jgi:hypothetical protein
MLKKYHDTVGKFYNELVEHSGKVTMEDFWQRYEYRCGDLTRVMKELQLARQYEHLQKTKNNKNNNNNNNKKKKKKQEQHQSSSPSPSSGDVSTCGSRSRSYLSCLNVEEDPEEPKTREKPKAPEQASQPTVVESVDTVDTVDDEHHHHHHSDTAVNTVVVLDHMAKFKQGLHDDHGTPTIAEASAMETTKTMEQEEEDDVDSLTDDGSNRESNNNVNVPSIFRRTTENVDQKKTAFFVASSDVEKKDDEVDDEQKVVAASFLKEKSNKTGATLLMIWITCILFALCLQTSNSTIPLSGSYNHYYYYYYYYGNVLCGPIRPGKTLDASSLAAENNNRMGGKKNYVSTVTFAAPWWAPESIREPVHDRFCSGRPRTILNAEVRSKKRRGGDYLNFMSVTIEDSDPSKKIPLMKFNRKKSIGVDATGERIRVENLNGRQKGIAEFGAPWALP